MGKLLRFIDPKAESMFKDASERARSAIFENTCDEQQMVYRADVTIALARAVYEVFYHLYDLGCSPADICEEVEWFAATMETNLPNVKKNVWDWHGNKQKEETV